MERLRDLPLGVPARAGIRHSQAGGDAVGGEEEIALPCPEVAVKIEGEAGVTLDNGGRFVIRVNMLVRVH
jgi:hypothetical protein